MCQSYEIDGMFCCVKIASYWYLDDVFPGILINKHHQTDQRPTMVLPHLTFAPTEILNKLSPLWSTIQSPILEKYFTSIQMFSRTNIFLRWKFVPPPPASVPVHEVDFLNCHQGEPENWNIQKHPDRRIVFFSHPLPLSMTRAGYEYCSEFLRLKRVVFSQKIGSSSVFVSSQSDWVIFPSPLLSKLSSANSQI